MMLFNISDITLTTVFYLVPFFDADLSINVLFMVAAVASADALLHVFDKRINLMVSLMPTAIMISGIGMKIYLGPMTAGIAFLFVLLMVMIIFDILCIMEHPEELDIIGRGNLKIFLEKEAEMQERIEEEGEVLRLKEEELLQLNQEIETLQQQLHEEEEMLKIKEEEIDQISQEIEENRKELTEEQELLKIREDNMENMIQSRVEERLMEEEEFLRTKDDEVIRLRDELEAQKSLYEETKRELMEKEHRIQNLKEDIEERMRREMEEEFVRKMREETEITSTRGKQEKLLFPFDAIIGQTEGKRALILNAVYPDVGGVLLRGEKGTAKSVAVRGLAEVLPNIKVTGCRYNCDPEDHDTLCPECHGKLMQDTLNAHERPVKVVELPLNVTEDRLLGSLDIEMVLGEGRKVFEQGMLADAHRGILYVDEINLLDDYIVDILLDAASSKRVRVEREGISATYHSDFIIVGSMNPEEGELRPQLLDRISLVVNMKGIDDIEDRMNIILNRQDFTAHPEEFRSRYTMSQEELKAKIERARELIPRVNISNSMLRVIADLCRDFKTAGHRADIAIERGARANAALEGRVETNLEDILIAARMALPHRVKRRSMDDDEFSDDILEEWFESRELS